MFVEITNLVIGVCPKGGLQITDTSLNVKSVFWQEAARYVLYEERYDHVEKDFNPPQFPSILYNNFEKICKIFKKDLHVYTSEKTTTEQLLEEVVEFIESKQDLSSSSSVETLKYTLFADRYHPQIHPQNHRKSIMYKSDENFVMKITDPDITNRYLTACLPPFAKACCIMTGFIKQLKAPIYILVRIENGNEIKGLIEVKLPLKFLFLVLTNNKQETENCFQIGRCFASLLQNKNFQAVINTTDNPKDLFKAAEDYRQKMIIVPNCKKLLSSPDGIDVARVSRKSINFDRYDLIFEDFKKPSDDNLESVVTVEKSIDQPDSLAKCTLSGLLNLCPPFKEIRNGAKLLWSRIPSDYTDAIAKDNIGTVLSSILFIYFVVFGPAITFGTLMLNEVNPSFSISLNILSAGVYTIIFSLFAGQPLGSIGPSGPGFILETVIAVFARELGADFAIYRFWVGIYISITGFVLIALNLSPLFIYARRSLEELFSSFISLFLILKAIFSMFKILPTNLPVVNTTTANQTELASALLQTQKASVAAVNLFLSFLMLVFSLCIRKFKDSVYFRRTFRYWIGAFNVPIGILFVTLVERIFFAEYHIHTLDIPSASEFNVSSWVTIVDFNNVLNLNQPSIAVAQACAFITGLCFGCLIFTEIALNSVTALKPKAKKPSPFVIDHILAVIIFPIISCILGWPFMSGVPVRTIANTMALVKVDSHPPPGQTAEIISLVEQRVSVLTVGVLVTVSVFLGDILRYIPVAALYGMFIFLGLNGLRGLDLINCLMALLSRRKYWGKWTFLTDIPKPQLAVFTLIWFLELGILVFFIIIAEFANGGYVSLATPIILIGAGLLREFILPKWHWLGPSLERIDKRCIPKPVKSANLMLDSELTTLSVYENVA